MSLCTFLVRKEGLCDKIVSFACSRMCAKIITAASTGARELHVLERQGKNQYIGT